MLTRSTRPLNERDFQQRNQPSQIEEACKYLKLVVNKIYRHQELKYGKLDQTLALQERQSILKLDINLWLNMEQMTSKIVLYSRHLQLTLQSLSLQIFNASFQLAATWSGFFQTEISDKSTVHYPPSIKVQ